nr:MAG TPA: Endonuclease [Caudoviricetes sp.]
MMKPKYSKKSKYGSRKVTIDGITFDSIRECNRYEELKLLERAGKITNLQRQVKYLLIPSQYEAVEVNGKQKNICVERACVYVADFIYMENGLLVVEDCKGFKTEAYKIKRKLMLQNYGIKIRET